MNDDDDDEVAEGDTDALVSDMGMVRKLLFDEDENDADEVDGDDADDNNLFSLVGLNGRI